MSALGVSQSIANQLGGAVSGFLKSASARSFLLYYYLPAAGFILVNAYLILPIFGVAAPDISQFQFQPGEAALGGDLVALLADVLVSLLSVNVLSFLVLPLLLAALTGALSLTITKLFEGLLPFQRALLRPWLDRNHKKCEQVYGPLKAKRRQYLSLINAQEDMESDEAIALASEIQELHEKIEEGHSDETLPKDPKRVAPTALGNVLAVAEEYPFDRYGIDSVLFWPRLRAEVPAEQLVELDATKGSLDGLLNVSLLAYVFMLEAIAAAVTRLFVPVADAAAPGIGQLLLAAVVAALLGLASYRAAVSVAGSMGRQLQTLFDYYRGDVLKRFDLSLPSDRIKEKVQWLQLAAFLRRGEPFYFPKPAAKKEGD